MTTSSNKPTGHPTAQALALLETMSKATDNPQMPIQQVTLFLNVAARGEVPQSALEELTGVSQAAVSRNVTALGEGWAKEPGYGLLVARRNASNRRCHVVALTQKGKALAWDMEQAARQAAT